MLTHCIISSATVMNEIKSNIDHHSGEPIYRQIVEILKFQIARGDLVSGDQLPSLRALANDLGINIRTVAKAYDNLVHGGLAVQKQGRGVFVTAPKGKLPMRRRRGVLVELSKRLISEAKRLGAEPDEVIEILQEIAEQMETHS